MISRFAPLVGLLVGLVPAIAHAQTDLDHGKTPAQIFAADCAVCHKGIRGLASGKTNASLSAFLREHYTTSREQAAALAAYVLKTAAEEAKASQQARQPKPEEGTPPAKLQRPPDDDTKADDATTDESAPGAGRRPAAGRGERQPPGAATARGRRKERDVQPTAQTTARDPSAAVAEPGAGEMPSSEMNPVPSAAAAPSDSGTSDSAPVPRDDIPD